MKKVILFDLGDTLISDTEASEVSFIATAKQAQKKFGIDPKELTKAVKKRARELWRKMPTYQYCLDIGISSWEGLWMKSIKPQAEILTRDYQVDSWYLALRDFDVDDKEFAKELSQVFQKERRGTTIFLSGALEILKKLKQNYRLGLITNGASILQWEKIKGSGIKSFFEHIAVSEDEGVGKPNKEIFDILINKFSASNEDVIMVGNSIGRDIMGAKNAGIKSIWINIEKEEDEDMEDKKAEPDGVIFNLNELSGVLEKLGF